MGSQHSCVVCKTSEHYSWTYTLTQELNADPRVFEVVAKPGASYRIMRRSVRPGAAGAMLKTDDGSPGPSVVGASEERDSADGMERIAAPATPLVCNGPYFQVWSPRGNLTEHITVSVPNRTGDSAWGPGTPKELAGLIRVDGRTARFLGARGAADAATQTDSAIFPLRTVYTFEAGGRKVQLVLTWTTAAIPTNLTLMSLPVTYITFAVRSLDGEPHAVEVYFDATAQLVTLPAISCGGAGCRRSRPQ